MSGLMISGLKLTCCSPQVVIGKVSSGTPVSEFLPVKGPSMQYKDFDIFTYYCLRNYPAKGVG
ncbi:MAG: hypothetical protein U0T81_01080 [Saprospiraceae bacterium]